MQAGRVVPPTGVIARLTGFTAGAMAFLAVFALALSLASGRLADRWAAALADSATIRISAPPGQMETQTRAVLKILSETPGVASANALTKEAEKKLLTPWFGPGLPLGELPIPQLIDVQETGKGFDAEGLRQRLSAEAPGAVLDDHARWRRPLVRAAERLRLLGLISIALLTGATAAMITLAANAALAANAQVIRVLRLIGARDSYIARAFVRRFTLRALGGAVAGTGLGMLAIAVMPAAAPEGGFLTGLGFAGIGWLWPLLIPPLAAIVAFAATRFAAFRTLRGLS
ncbi:cell division protein FtsX [Acidimangrovimonas sediminis]|uniref:cell division protein FtsX n=1 Tax=Acidimangrovimonas sediminis TaxID=2056283 RepID=UPI000C809AFD|nr:cell division protein FtsX [Acidimangrovimonas sediminis]